MHAYRIGKKHACGFSKVVEVGQASCSQPTVTACIPIGLQAHEHEAAGISDECRVKSAPTAGKISAHGTPLLIYCFSMLNMIAAAYTGDGA